MVTIELEDDCIIGEDEEKKAKEIGKNINFKKKLIFQVRSHRLLYDNKHKMFSNVAKKEIVWQQIAEKLKSNVENCKETWFELRYLYQQHVRRLRNYFIHGQKVNCKRPAMYMETELTFLWRFIENRKTCKLPFDIPEAEYAETETIEILDINSQQPEEVTDVIDPINSGSIDKEVEIVTIDDDLILVEQPVEVIVIDEDDDSGKMENQFKLSPIMKSLVTQIKSYPELYDSDNLAFKDYTRKSYIWNSIAGTLADKATKLMKCWIIMQTRYEWEISQSAKKSDNTALRDSTKKSELQVELDFLKNYILKNPDTVYKQSYFLKSSWFDPIDYFKDIYNLIVRMKKMTDIVYITDSLLKTPDKSKQYISLWTEIANLKCSTAGQCETTWLIMRHFYWELMHMRQQNYQLTDKWYFETIITELYEISKSAQAAKQQELQVLKQNKSTKKANKRPAQTSATSLGAPSSQRQAVTPTAVQQITPAIVNNFQSAPATNTIPASVAQSLTLPKITAAISLAPQSLNNGMLQIKQIPCPPTLSPAPQQRNFINGGPLPMVALPASMSTTAASSQIPMSFNLPTQTKLTSIPMPSLIRPIGPTITQPTVTQPTVRPVSKSLISIRPKPAISSAAPKIQIASWATAPNTSVNCITSPQVTVNQQISTLTSGSSNKTPTHTQTPTHSISSNIIPTLPPKNTSVVATITTPATSSSTTTANNSSQLPKITGAVSLLNPNEILIELVSSQNGNQLVVHGPPLSAKYQLSMPMVANFIRQVLAIPLLHNKNVSQPGVINYFWEHIGQKFNLPVHICRACWNFLLENFNHFPQIAPLKELMKPFQTALSVWTESYVLFEKFDSHCAFKGWLEYKQSLPDVVQCIGAYPVLYQDVAIHKKNEILSDMETLCVWRTIGLRFPKIPEIREIWNALKVFFVQYMTDLENGIENIWPLNWWRALARLKFLVEARYTANEPFFYIITNKMIQEIDRCAMLEMKNRSKNDSNQTNPDNENAQKELEDSQTKSSDSIEPLIASLDKGKEKVELGALIRAIQKYPIIFNKGDNEGKYQAWFKAAQELNISVTDCILAFKHQIEMYYAYKKQDSVNRCRINERYYKKLDEIVRSLSSASSHGKLNIKTPFELNHSLESDNSSDANDFVFPERYISDISMSNSPSNLVVKNWIYAIGNLNHFSETSNLKFKEILKKYLPDIKK